MEVTLSQQHQRQCPKCRAREWCITVMDLIAQANGYLSWEMLEAENRIARMKPSEQ